MWTFERESEFFNINSAVGTCNHYAVWYCKGEREKLFQAYFEISWKYLRNILYFKEIQYISKRIHNGLPNFRLYWKAFFRATDGINRSLFVYKFACSMSTRAIEYNFILIFI